MSDSKKILAYIPKKYTNQLIAAVDDIDIIVKDSYIEFLEAMTDGEYLAAIFYSKNLQEIRNTVILSVKIDFPLIRLIPYLNEEQIVETIKLGFDDCISLDNILRLQRIIKQQLHDKNRTKVKKQSDGVCIRSDMLKIFDYLPNMILLKDADTFNYEFINAKGEDLLGIKKENIIGKNVFDIVPEEVAKYHHNKDLEALKSKSPVYIDENLVPTSKNNIRYLEGIKVLITNGDNNKKYILDYSLDQTNRKLISNELNITQRRFETIFNSSPNILIIESVQTGHIIAANPVFRKIASAKIVNIIGKPLKDFSIWIDDYKIEEMQSLAIETGKAHNQVVRLIDANGELRYYMLSLDYISVDQHECLLYTGQDITDKSEGEIELKRLLRKQKSLAQLKNRFISLISHEFRTPLTTIMLSTDLLKRYSMQWDDGEKNKHFDRIQQTILSMTKMLENVTILSRIESKEIDIVPERINLIQFAQAMAETASMSVHTSTKIVIKNVSKFEEIVSDENLLGLSLINIIYNSIRFTKNSDPIEVYITIEDKIATIKISDKGVGIKEKDLQYVTQAFYRGDNSINLPGYGLGLSITEKAIEMLGGTLDISSTQHLGTTVTISIPRYIV